MICARMALMGNDTKTAPVAAKGSPAESNGHIVSHGARARPLPPDGGPKDARTRDAWIQPVIQSVGEPSRRISRTPSLARTTFTRRTRT